MRILLLCPDFFGYDVLIVNKLKERGHFVLSYNEVPLKSHKLYFLLEKFGAVIKKYLWNRYENILIKSINENKIDTVFIIRGIHLPEKLVHRFKKELALNIINYQWDSTSNNLNALMISRYSDYNFTFDKDDANKYDFFHYLPLFYDWENFTDNLKINCHYDITYICSWSQKRLEVLKSLEKICKENQLKFYPFVYIPFQTFVRLLFKGKGFYSSFVHFKPMPKSKYFQIMKNTSITVDIPSTTQTGASMRTIEALSLGIKVLTSNKNVINESFYDSKSIQFWPISGDSLISFLLSKEKPSKSSGLYSLDQWINKIGL